MIYKSTQLLQVRLLYLANTVSIVLSLFRCRHRTVCSQRSKACLRFCLTQRQIKKRELR